MNQSPSPIEKANSWIKSSVSLKLITIGILVLILLIPASMIRSIIAERESLNRQATNEVSAKWAERQEIKGPILTIPMVFEYEKDGKTYTENKNWYILPENLSVNGNIQPKSLKRGIYKVVVYNSKLDLSGNFAIQEPDFMDGLHEIKYDQAYLTIGISDLKGIKNTIKVQWDSSQLDVEPGTRKDNLAYSGVSVDLPDLAISLDSLINFNFSIDLQGSQNMSFIPLGKSTNVSLSSKWSSPSFNGNFLPDERSISSEGFSAKWKVLQLNRNFPQSWIDADYSQQMTNSSFGVDLILPLDDYQKSMRSAKYAIMTIALTFLIFFLVEILNKRKIHPFQYILVGIGLCLFYILLVSISEHSNFNFAYIVSAKGIISIISLYSYSLFKKLSLTILMVLALTAMFGFLFVTLQLADYALLMGSIGLFIILSLTMYFTRKVDWYDLQIMDT